MSRISVNTQVQGNLTVKAIATISRRANEGISTMSMLSDITLDKFAHKHPHYVTNDYSLDVDTIIFYPDLYGDHVVLDLY